MRLGAKKGLEKSISYNEIDSEVPHLLLYIVGDPKKGRIGSSFDDFLKEQGTYEATRTIAIKRVLAWHLEKAMEQAQLSKHPMAKAMHTSLS